MSKPVNGLSFTVDMLLNLKKLLLDNNARETIGVCDYEWQAIDDAVTYLQRGPIDPVHHNNEGSRKSIFNFYVEDQYQKLERIIVNEAFKSVAYKVPSIQFDLPDMEIEMDGSDIKITARGHEVATVRRSDIDMIIYGDRYITVVIENGNTISLEIP